MPDSSTNQPINSMTKGARKPINIYGRAAGFCGLHANIVLLLWVVVAAASMSVAAWRLEVNTDPGKMISNELPFRKAFVDFTQAFPASDNNFIVVVESKDGDAAREASRSLVESFAAHPKLFSDVYAPGLGSFFDRYGVLYLPENEVSEIVKKVKQSGPILETLVNAPNFVGFTKVLEQMLPAINTGKAPASINGFLRQAKMTVTAGIKGKSRPLNWPAIVTGKKQDTPKRWYISIKPILDFSEIDPSSAALAQAQSIISDREVTRSGLVKISLTGEAALNGEEFESVTNGAIRAGIVSFFLVVVIIWLGMPVARLIIPAVSLLVFGFMVNIGFATLAVGSLNMISVAFAVLFIGLGIDYAVHTVLRFWEERTHGRDTLAAIAVGAHHAGPALALCTLTTSLAFLAFIPSDFVGMAQLGIIAAGGIVVSFLASMSLIPAVIAKLNLTPKQKHLTKVATLPKPVWQHLRLGTTVFTVMVAIAALVLLPDVRFDGDPVNLKDPKAKSVIAFKEILKKEPGEAYAAQVIVSDAAKAEILAAKLEQLASVKQVRWLDTFLPARQEAKLAQLSSLAKIVPTVPPRTKALDSKERRASIPRLKSLLLTIETSDKASKTLKQEASNLRRALLVLDIPKPASDARLKAIERDMFLQFPGLLAILGKMAVTEPLNALTIDRDIAKRYVTGDGRWRLEIVPAKDMSNQVALNFFVDDIRKLAPNVTGTPVEIIGAANVVSSAMGLATLVALGLVLVILVPVLRSFVPITLVLAPLVLSALLLLAYTVIFNSPFNFANVIVLPLLLGLGVDSAIHYVMRAREDGAKRQVIDTTTPRAVLISALTTIGSFGTLWLSPHKGTASMGELLTIAILITLVSTLIVLPQFVAWTIGRQHKQQ